MTAHHVRSTMSVDFDATHSADSVTQGSTGGDPSVAPDAPDPLALERALLNGLGISDLHLPEGLTPELMDIVGALLREATQGTIELLRLRAEAKSSLHADITILSARAVNPLKAAVASWGWPARRHGCPVEGP